MRKFQHMIHQRCCQEAILKIKPSSRTDGQWLSRKDKNKLRRHLHPQKFRQGMMVTLTATPTVSTSP
ncbi:hypothetical protein DPMN_124175 [Dreissena polymorpha]|uniref:Uncharacterized protein n=1 Tax=Dreissena polymorpha TaxID=45954 RepID=A0A9D4JW03_DREPO|nr:hypothetical protein DPMN_124175 [Dreissena polymorpha]